MSEPRPGRELLDAQRIRWQLGDQVSVESYLEQRPTLFGDRELVLDLIYQEILLREEEGEKPEFEEYLRRFPHFAETLALQFEVDRALRAQVLPEVCASISSAPQPALPGYELLEVLGRGGMGVVYKAKQVSLNRLVAVKMILSGEHAGPLELARFHTEAETVARLHHPNIVQIYEIGVQDGRPFMALELVDSNLAKRLASTPLPPRQAAEWIETLARAVHYAHQRGIVHRDLKPANVLINQESVLKITDFGMAKIVRGRPGGHTSSGAILGTPSYMAPEQAEGKTRLIGPATDVYGLGAILYELLTGRPPFRAPSTQEILDQVRLTDPLPPSRLNGKLPRDLEIICLTCLQKEPAKRYPSAAALADDLHAFLAGEPIRSRPTGRLERLIRWTRRRPAEAALLATGFAALIGLGVGVVWSHALAVGGMASLTLLLGSWWYSVRLRGVLGEVTQQQKLTDHYVDRLHLLLEMTQRLMRTEDLVELLRLLAETTVKLAYAELATIYVVDRTSGELVSKVTLDEGVGEIRLPLGVGIAGSVAVTGEPVNIADAYADPRFSPDTDRRTGHQTRNLLTIPMTGHDGSVLGVFQVINKQDGTFGVEDIEILSSLAASAAIGIERAVSAEVGDGKALPAVNGGFKTAVRNGS